MIDNAKRLIIIGNGFDLYHNLPTSYSFFESYLKKKSPYFHEELCSYLPHDILWSSFELALGELDVDRLLTDNLCYYESYSHENWRDAYHHDYQYEVAGNLLFADDIEELLKEWIRSIDISLAEPDKNIVKICIAPDTVFMSFNYTDVLEKIYGVPAGDICYVHGKAHSLNDLLIFGHHDDACIANPLRLQEYQYDDIRTAEAEEIVSSYFRKTFKDTAENIKRHALFFKKIFSVNEIYILGHSLSRIDLEYFEKIKKCVLSSCKWNISYYSNADKKTAIDFVADLGIEEYNLFEFC